MVDGAPPLSVAIGGTFPGGDTPPLPHDVGSTPPLPQGAAISGTPVVDGAPPLSVASAGDVPHPPLWAGAPPPPAFAPPPPHTGPLDAPLSLPGPGPQRPRVDATEAALLPPEGAPSGTRSVVGALPPPLVSPGDAPTPSLPADDSQPETELPQRTRAAGARAHRDNEPQLNVDAPPAGAPAPLANVWSATDTQSTVARPSANAARQDAALAFSAAAHLAPPHAECNDIVPAPLRGVAHGVAARNELGAPPPALLVVGAARASGDTFRAASALSSEQEHLESMRELRAMRAAAQQAVLRAQEMAAEQRDHTPLEHVLTQQHALERHRDGGRDGGRDAATYTCASSASHRRELDEVAQRRRAGRNMDDPLQWWCRKVAHDLELAHAAYRAAWGNRHMLMMFLDAAMGSTLVSEDPDDGESTCPMLGDGESVEELLRELNFWLGEARAARSTSSTRSGGEGGSSISGGGGSHGGAPRDAPMSAQMHLEAHHLLLSRRLTETRVATRYVLRPTLILLFAHLFSFLLFALYSFVLLRYVRHEVDALWSSVDVVLVDNPPHGLRRGGATVDTAAADARGGARRALGLTSARR